MSENEDSSFGRGRGRGRGIGKDYKRKRTTMKTAHEEGKAVLACEFCPPSRRKSYLSYPALYYHVR